MSNQVYIWLYDPHSQKSAAEAAACKPTEFSSVL